MGIYTNCMKQGIFSNLVVTKLVRNSMSLMETENFSLVRSLGFHWTLSWARSYRNTPHVVFEIILMLVYNVN